MSGLSSADHLETDVNLSRCPFCGEQAAFRLREKNSNHRPNFNISVECANTSCGVMTPQHYATREAATKAWNRRAEY